MKRSDAVRSLLERYEADLDPEDTLAGEPPTDGIPDFGEYPPDMLTEECRRAGIIDPDESVVEDDDEEDDQDEEGLRLAPVAA
ncbi:hypothetical protein LRS73_35510 (plasmid) [Methylobacterium currus]|uniref:hypothetical protein n=1 Tax=Methylobacterium currus TaxID=2051553 RepID=UPI001E62CD7C|nr:hypothetical protein [Methylobacterium currus]UHC20486.1 hypothetical protein LRS73_35510 [Methylobacterium currus]